MPKPSFTPVAIPPFGQDIASMYRAMLRMGELLQNLQGQRGDSPITQKIVQIQQQAGAQAQEATAYQAKTDGSLQTQGTRIQKNEDATDANGKAIDAATAGRVIGIEADGTPPKGAKAAWSWFANATGNLSGMSLVQTDAGYGTLFEAGQLYIDDPAVTKDGATLLFGRSGGKFIFNAPFALDGADIFDGTVANAALADGAVTQLASIKGALSASIDVNVRRDSSQVLVIFRFRYRDDPAIIGTGKKGRVSLKLDGATVADIVVLDQTEGGSPASRGYVLTNGSMQVDAPTKGKHTFAVSSTWDTSLGTDTEVSLTVLEFAA